MSRPAIKAEGVWKEYSIRHSGRRPDTFYDLLTAALRSPLSSVRRMTARIPQQEKFWALRDVSFEVQPGEVIGVVGRNGAGKSTLLKTLSRITAVSRGRIEVRGRLTSLLEVGTGFHPELSGRENIYLNATILGMTRVEINRQLEQIVEFSGIGKFLDTAVKRYSSGMYVRLAFAVAAHVQADILLVDEVLAVGDSEFQRRCLGKMEEVASGGRTVFFVSHNLTAVRSLCSKGLLFENGRLTEAGPVESILKHYSEVGSIATNERILPAVPSLLHDAYVSRVAVRPGNSSLSESPVATKPIVVTVDTEVVEPGDVGVFIHCYDSQQVMVFSSGSFFDKTCDRRRLPTGTHRFTCEIPKHLLNDGAYSLDVMLVRNQREVFWSEPSVLRFLVEDDFPAIDGWQWRPAGVVRPILSWRHQQITPPPAPERRISDRAQHDADHVGTTS